MLINNFVDSIPVMEVFCMRESYEPKLMFAEVDMLGACTHPGCSCWWMQQELLIAVEVLVNTAMMDI
eukprot:scaffold109487_cov20-Tisochrysis_lutea.AAC.1